eukprot:scpid19507/ scgid11761/ 
MQLELHSHSMHLPTDTDMQTLTKNVYTDSAYVVQGPHTMHTDVTHAHVTLERLVYEAVRLQHEIERRARERWYDVRNSDIGAVSSLSIKLFDSQKVETSDSSPDLVRVVVSCQGM